jgi:hypothetical protein
MTVEQGLQSQLRNIETQYGRSIPEWIAIINASGREKHGEIVAWLKADYGLPHGAANRLALVALDARKAAATGAAAPTGGDEPADVAAELYAGPKASLLPIHERLMGVVGGLPDVEIAPKRGYLSLRHRKQFAMIKPAARHVDLGLIRPGVTTTDRLESAATFNALFTHRVRVRSIDDVDAELIDWIRAAHAAAG